MTPFYSCENSFPHTLYDLSHFAPRAESKNSPVRLAIVCIRHDRYTSAPLGSPDLRRMRQLHRLTGEILSARKTFSHKQCSHTRLYLSPRLRRYVGDICRDRQHRTHSLFCLTRRRMSDRARERDDTHRRGRHDKKRIEKEKQRMVI